VRAWIANTDYEWYRLLSGRPDIDEVNFWRPSGGAFRALSPGEPLLFRLKAPHNKIAGLGFFVDWTLRENVRAQLRVLVKRILRKYGYPPDKQEQATKTVLEQAELLSEQWAYAS
jgi:hypothetical protein